MIALFFAGTILMSCGDSGGGKKKTDEELQIERLAKSWGLDASSTVMRDIDDITTDYSGFVITFTSTMTYTITGDALGVFAKSSGTWNFVKTPSVNLGRVELDMDPRALNINVNNDGTVLSFDFQINDETPIGTGRTQGLNGDYQFSNLVPN